LLLSFVKLIVLSFIVITIITRTIDSKENITKPTWCIGIYEGRTPFDPKAPPKDVNGASIKIK